MISIEGSSSTKYNQICAHKTNSPRWVLTSRMIVNKACNCAVAGRTRALVGRLPQEGLDRLMDDAGRVVVADCC